MKDKLLKTIRDAREYTLAVAEALPEEHYNTSPAAATWSFGERMNHIAYGLNWWEDNYITGKTAEWNPPAPLPAKATILAALAVGFDSLSAAVSNSEVNDGLITGVWSALDHVTHHRGQATFQLRYHNIIPPEYVAV
jgi:uncharacterized damage-inducible protein DinB